MIGLNETSDIIDVEFKEFVFCKWKVWYNMILEPRFSVNASFFLDRIFLPQLESHFEDAIEQLDPEAMVEDEYKWVSVFRWKSFQMSLVKYIW